jgi:hypothetical protein
MVKMGKRTRRDKKDKNRKKYSLCSLCDRLFSFGLPIGLGFLKKGDELTVSWRALTFD